jgi:hypothetical protein
MWKNVLAHWRGELDPLTSCLLGLVAPVPIIIGATTLPLLIIILVGLIGGSPAAKILSVPRYLGYVSTCTLIAVLLIGGTWLGVGIFRCGVRYASDRTNTTARRIGGVAATAWGLLIVFSTGDAVKLLGESYETIRETFKAFK